MYSDKFAQSKHSKKFLGYPKIELNMLIARLGMTNTYYTLGLYMYVVFFIFY